MHFYKPCTSATSESEFDHGNRILYLKVGVLVIQCQGYKNVTANYRSLSHSMVAARIALLLQNRP